MLFPLMNAVIKPGKRGVAKIDHIDVTKEAAIMAMIGSRLRMRTGPHVRLYVKGELMMSDGMNEHITNIEVIRRAKGNVLIAGLGIGMILTRILEGTQATNVTVIERYQDVIDLVAPSFNDPRLKIICADINDWKPPKGTKYDCIYFDIWPTVTGDNLPHMARLHQRFKSYKAADGWMDSWQCDYLKNKKRREKRQGWYT